VQATLHPALQTTSVVCANCGTRFEVRSTATELTLDVCSHCHPAYTGQVRSHVAGDRVERFERRRARAARA
jgi:large subunit ribosomal protein L31